ncbi:mitochondrial resolvase Ydc2 [Boeremia exigua]|uniref:mitochondrial resolvase Ydc2 n=1 Tax=Boeremia exigua TaxID=749465 RepID=UPI001E8D7325|nr:mitochondrial resolvase Ydc2 [Boeremia exigua]KAH6639357.1 mitochondrial resolvase Ydc2 [Boeremia exigua]
MAPKKLAVTSKTLQSLLTRIGSASSGTKNTLFARFQRDVLRPGFPHVQLGPGKHQPGDPGQKLRIMSIDMGIKNLAFCDAEISHAALGTGKRQGFDTHMNVLRWKKLDLMNSTYSNGGGPPQELQEAADALDADLDAFSPSVLSKTAFHLITKEVLSASPDIILIEKQRWRSGGGSAVQQWTLRVNTLEAMLWAVLETLKQSRAPHRDQAAPIAHHAYLVHAVDPKRVGQYWLGQQARAVLAHDAVQAHDLAPDSDPDPDLPPATPPKQPSRSKAEKSAKIAILRSWLAHDPMSTRPSTPHSMPRISFTIDAGAASTLAALLPKGKAVRRKKAPKGAESAGDVPSAAEITKLDDVTDCFLQAAAWVAWEANRRQLLAVSGEEGAGAGVGEEAILSMVEWCGE